MAANFTTFKWNAEEALRCKEVNVFLTDVYGKCNAISFKKHSFYWSKNKNFIFVDYIIEDDQKIYLRIADDKANVIKAFNEINKPIQLIDEFAITESNSGYKYFCSKSLDFFSLSTFDFPKADHFKELMCENQISHNKFINMTDIKTIEDILFLGSNLRQARRISIVGKNLPKTVLNRRAVRPNGLRNKIKEAINNGSLVDVSEYNVTGDQCKVISHDIAKESNLIFSEKIGIASNNKRSFENAYKDSYCSDQRMSEEYTNDYEYILSMFDQSEKDKILEETADTSAIKISTSEELTIEEPNIEETIIEEEPVKKKPVKRGPKKAGRKKIL